MASLADPREQQFTVRKLHPTIGLEVSGLDPAKPLGRATVAALTRLSAEHKLLVFRGKGLTAPELHHFASQFGNTNQVPARMATEDRERHDGKHNVSRLGSIGDPKGPGEEPTGYGALIRFWHSDSSWRPLPTWLTFLAAVELPDKDGDTCFADMQAAYDALSAERKAQLEGKQMIHAWATMRMYEPSAPPLEQDPPPSTHPVVRTIEGRKSLFLGGHTCFYVGNMPFDEGKALFDELMAHATAPEFVYRHTWSPGDLLMWDNRTTMHRRLPYDFSQRRAMYRAEVVDTEPPR